MYAEGEEENLWKVGRRSAEEGTGPYNCEAGTTIRGKSKLAVAGATWDWVTGTGTRTGLGWKVESRQEVEPHFPSWMSPQRNAEGTDWRWVFFSSRLMPGQLGGGRWTAGIGDLPRPVHEVGNCGQLGDGRLGRLEQHLAEHLCCHVSPLPFASCLVLYLSSNKKGSRGQMPRMPPLCWLTSPRPNGRRFSDSATEAAAGGAWAWTRWEKEKDRSPCTSQAKHTPTIVNRGGGAPQSWAKGFFSLKLLEPHHEESCIHHTIKGPGEAGAEGLHRSTAKKTCGAFEGS
ncbi:hypothetical protein QBC39DRAFT_67644 [Podospora conica]|nr:hypothetical protein QBC39DRAFT_67644 [Schizothecium conicum]